MLVQVCQHPNARMREWGAEAITSLIKAGLSYKHQPLLSHNQVTAHPDDLREERMDLISNQSSVFSSETPAAAVEPAEGAVQRPSRRHQTETAGVRSSDPSEPGR